MTARAKVQLHYQRELMGAVRMQAAEINRLRRVLVDAAQDVSADLKSIDYAVDEVAVKLRNRLLSECVAPVPMKGDGK